MYLFLASNIGGVKKENGNKIPIKFFENNDFLKNLKKIIKNNKKFVLVASDPDNYERNDLFLQIISKQLTIFYSFSDSANHLDFFFAKPFTIYRFSFSAYSSEIISVIRRSSLNSCPSVGLISN